MNSDELFAQEIKDLRRRMAALEGLESTAKNSSGLPIYPVLTPGSMLFAGSGGALAQDNTNLFWDDTNNMLGVGTNIPQADSNIFAKIVAKGNNATAVQNWIINQNSGEIGFVLQRTGGAGTGYWNMRIPTSSTDLRFNRQDVGDILTIGSNGGLSLSTTTTLANTILNHRGSVATQSGIAQAASANCFVCQSTYAPGARFLPGIVWNTTDDNNDKPKAAIHVYADGSGSRMFLMTSGNYGIGANVSNLVLYPTGTVDVPNYLLSVGTQSGGNAYISFNGRLNPGVNWVYDKTDYACLWGMESGVHTWYTAASGTAGNTISWTQRMTLGNTGNLKLGSGGIAVGQLAGLAVALGGNSYVEVSDGVRTGFIGADSTDAVLVAAYSNHALHFRQNNTRRGFIGTDSYWRVETRLMIGSASTPSYLLEISADSAAKPGTNTWTVISDATTKRNIRPYTHGMELISRLQPKYFKYNGYAGTPNDGQEHVGLIAQEIEQEAPQMIKRIRRRFRMHPDSDEQEQEVLVSNSNEVQYAVINALKQHEARINALERQFPQKNMQ